MKPRIVTGEVERQECAQCRDHRRRQAVEHYEITRYGSLIAWAKRLGRNNIAKVLEQTLHRGKGGRPEATDIAESKVNLKAA